MIDWDDSDTCPSAELNRLFDHSLRLSSEKAVSFRNDSLFYLDISSDFSKIVSAAFRKAYLFHLDHTNGFTQIGANISASINIKELCGIRFWNENPNNVTIAEETGEVTTYDLRSGDIVMEIKNEQSTNDLFNCFDISDGDKYFCLGGMKNQKNEVPILFYDIRTKTNSHCYVDSHGDNVTQVKFHPTKSNIIVTGSMDGLINIFNIDERDEDEALLSTINSESSIETLNWHPKNGKNEYHLSCISHQSDLMLFDMETEDMVCQHKRSAIAEAIKRKSVANCWIIDCHSDAAQDIFVLVGSNFNDGECLRSLTVTENSLKQRNNFSNNKQIVRCSAYNARDNVLLTAGENDIISVWDARVPNTPQTDSNKLKEKVHKDRKSKPY